MNNSTRTDNDYLYLGAKITIILVMAKDYFFLWVAKKIGMPKNGVNTVQSRIKSN